MRPFECLCSTNRVAAADWHAQNIGLVHPLCILGWGAPDISRMYNVNRVDCKSNNTRRPAKYFTAVFVVAKRVSANTDIIDVFRRIDSSLYDTFDIRKTPMVLMVMR